MFQVVAERVALLDDHRVVPPVAEVAVDRERVEVRVRPAHRGLEDVVQLGQADTTGDEEPTPDHRGHLVKLDPQLEDLLSGRHRGSRRSAIHLRE